MKYISMFILPQGEGGEAKDLLFAVGGVEIPTKSRNGDRSAG